MRLPCVQGARPDLRREGSAAARASLSPAAPPGVCRLAVSRAATLRASRREGHVDRSRDRRHTVAAVEADAARERRAEQLEEVEVPAQDVAVVGIETMSVVPSSATPP